MRIQAKKRQFLRLGIILLLGLSFLPLQATTISLDQLSRVVIMEEGRLKPLDTFARNIMKELAGRSEINGRPAIQQLARIMFTPDLSFDDPVFLITHPGVLDAIGVKRQGKARNRYSFTTLRRGWQALQQLAYKASKIDREKRSLVDNEILGLYHKLVIYQQLLGSFDFFEPHSNFTLSTEVARYLGFPVGSQGTKESQIVSFYDLAQKIAKIREKTPIMSKGEAEPSPVEKELAQLEENLRHWASFSGELPLTIIPPLGDETTVTKWQAPWNLAAAMLGVTGAKALSPSYGKYLAHLQEVYQAYRSGDQERFDRAVSEYNLLVIESNQASGTGSPLIRPGAVALEVLYNTVDPFYKAKFFYGFAIILLLLSFLAWAKWFYRVSFFLLLGGFLLHLSGVVARMVIRLRPPVTNLYETFVFTGLITVLLGMILELFKKRNTGIFTGSLAGLVMLMIAGKYAMDGDTMGMLVAVLDSNFWLASHVITIILGYAGIVLSGFIAHVYLLQEIFFTNRKALLKNTFQAIYGIQAFGLIFTFLGTVLGGIWADQSWGRFWGWDPKENGALLILLWSAILFHARLAGWIKERGMAFGAVVGVIAVSLAWFGVNLLGVGLHSYGFTSGVARTLFIFIGAEIIFIITTAVMLTFKKNR